MTDIQKAEVMKMRANSITYREIAESLGLPLNTVKSYGVRHEKADRARRLKEQGITLCENCGAEVQQRKKGKNKRFCSDNCRNDWWNHHPDLINRKAIYRHVCHHCGKHFVAYGNARRKYCCHECYIADRFGGGSDD